MAAPSTSADQKIESKDALIDWFESGNKPQEKWKIGTN